MPRLGPKWDDEFDVIWDSATGFYRVWLIHLGRRYGMLQAMNGSSPTSAAALADRLSLSSDAVGLWLDAAYSLGMVDKSSRGYSLPRGRASLLADEDAVSFLGGMPSYLALRSLDFERFDGFFRDGRAPREQPHSGEAFKAGTVWDHTAFLKLVLPNEEALQGLLAGGARVLDVGAGAGGWSVKLAERFTASTFVGIDPDSRSISEGTRRAQRLGLRNVILVVGDAESMRFSGEFDVVYLGEVLSLVSSRESVLGACSRALKRGGSLVVCEGVVAQGRRSRMKENQLASAMQLDIALQGGRFLSKAELVGLLKRSGFGGVRFYDVGGGLCFLVARR